jgi:ferric-dicitrate binding protein FerR (iron transport regulator)
MKTVVWPWVFAAAFAFTLAAGNWVAVDWLGWLADDPMYAETNRWVFRQILPVLTAVATLSAFLGGHARLRSSENSWRRTVVNGLAAGALSGIALMVFVWWNPRRLIPSAEPLAGYALALLALAMPGVIAYMCWRLWVRKTNT